MYIYIMIRIHNTALWSYDSKNGERLSYLSVDRLQLLEGGQHEDGRLAHTRLGLAQDVHSQDGLNNSLIKEDYLLSRY